MPRTVTLLGCGIVGSWMAHHLTSLGYTDFILFDGGPDRPTTRRLTPLGQHLPRATTAAVALAAYIRSVNPTARITVNGNFSLDSDVASVKGDVVGGMRALTGGPEKLCSPTRALVLERGHSWITVIPPTAKNARYITTRSARHLTPENLGTPRADKHDLMLATAKAANLLAGGLRPTTGLRAKTRGR